jgi:hypothetical protein
LSACRSRLATRSASVQQPHGRSDFRGVLLTGVLERLGCGSGRRARAGARLAAGCRVSHEDEIVVPSSFTAHAAGDHAGPQRGEVPSPSGPKSRLRLSKRLAAPSSGGSRHGNVHFWLPSVSTGGWEGGRMLGAAGSGNDWSEEPVWGCEPATLDFTTFPGVLPGPSPRVWRRRA